MNPPTTHLPISMNEVVVLIPAYNEAETIRHLVECILKVVRQVVVVDDGSGDGTCEQLAGLPVTVLRNTKNLGKAAALWKGFDHVLAGGAKYIITMDGDSQHRPADIGVLLNMSERFPADIVIGARLHDRKHFPARRFYANQFARFWISWASGYPIADTQSGFRVYPATLFAQITRREVSWNGFVFESEILIAASDCGVRSVATAIPGIYPKHARPSHFRPILDIARIVTMVAWRLLRRGMYPVGLWRSLKMPAVIYKGLSWTSMTGATVVDHVGGKTTSLQHTVSD